MFSHTHEGLGDISVDFGTGLVEFDVFGLHEFFILVLDELVVVVAFVGENEDRSLGSAVGSDFFEPDGRNILKGFGIIDIIDDDDSIGLIVVALGDAFEAFLSGSVPDFHFDELSLDRN